MVEAVHPRDVRGWFYRMVAPSHNCAVLQVGDGHAENWFANLVRSDLRTPSTAACDEQFELIVLHHTLGGCETLRSAIESATRLLRKGAVLVVAGENRIGLPRYCAQGGGVLGPRATGWGFRSMMEKAGLENVALFITHPPGSAPMYVVHTDRLSARAFFRAALNARQLPRWSPVRLAQITLIELNLMSYVQPGFVVVGRKC